MRLDLFLSKQHNFTRNKAQQLISAGLVSVNGKVTTKSSSEVSESDSIEIQEDRRVHWVSRSAEKLAGFLEKLRITNYELRISGTRCLDVGSSTGGFTQVLLEYGAAHVDAVDVGTDQLHESIRSDARVTSYEQMDIREFGKVVEWKGSGVGTGATHYLGNSTPPRPHAPTPPRYDLIVCDASFISLHDILPSILSFADNDTNMILLYKPQFEVGRENLRKTGVPKDEKIIEEKMNEFEQFLRVNKCEVLQKEKSTLIGEAGNQEWIYLIKKTKAK